MAKLLKNKLSIVVIPYLFLVIIKTIMSMYMKVPIVWPDEYIYLLTAKLIAGIDIITFLPSLKLVGSFGYSIIISPIFIIFSDPYTVYGAITLFNSILSSTLLIGLYYILKLLLDAENKEALIISFIVCLYPANLLQSNSAWTDAISPAFFVFVILALYKLIQKNNLLWTLIFSIAAGFLLWIHIRFIPLIIVSILFVIILCYIKKINIKHCALSIFILICFLFLNFFIGDSLNKSLGGKIVGTNILVHRLLKMSEVFYIILTSISIIYSFLSRKTLLLISTFVGILIGLLLNYSFIFALSFPILFIFLHKLKNTFHISKTYIVAAVFNSIIVTLILYILRSYSKFDGFNSIIYIKWLTNGLGVIFYSLISTYLIGFVGIIYLFYNLFISQKDSIFINKFSDKSENSSSIDNQKLSLIYIILSAFSLFVITISTYNFGISHYRADHFFYGRYIETFLSTFIAIGILQMIRIKKKILIRVYIISILFLITCSLILISVYGNIITTELSIRSVLSFFPLRALLGNINILFISAFGILVFTLIVLTKKKPIIYYSLIGSSFLTFSLLTYYYVFIYHQYEQQNKNYLINNIIENFPEIDTIYYDKKINSEYSRNLHHYNWLLKDKVFVTFQHKKIKNLINKLVISNKYYGLINSPNSIILDVEYNGFDHLWLTPGELQDSLREDIMPSNYDIPLNLNFVAGVLRKDFYKHTWIKKSSIINFQLEKPKNFFSFEFVFNNTTHQEKLVKIFNFKDSVYEGKINPGRSKINIDYIANKTYRRISLKFASSLDTMGYEIKGISLDTFIMKYRKYETNENFSQNDYLLPKNLNFTMRFRRNIDVFLLKLQPNQEVTLPVIIQNKDNRIIYINKKRKIYVTYNWLDFVFKNPVYQNYSKSELSNFIEPGKEGEVLLKIKAPEKEGRYFLQLYFYQDNNGIIEQYSETGNLFLFDTRKSIKRISY